MNSRNLLKKLLLCITKSNAKEGKFIQEHKQWLTYAKNELKAAQLLLESEDGAVILPALYMTQQCAEKALKAFLIFKGMNPGKIHDLHNLVNKCIKYDEDFNTLKEAAITLNPYNLGTRYPNSFLPAPDTSIIMISIKSTALIVEFIKNKIE